MVSAVETGSRYLSGYIANNINSSSLGPAARISTTESP